VLEGFLKGQTHTVQLVTEKGMPVGKGARELDIHLDLLHLWIESKKLPRIFVYCYPIERKIPPSII
jgi:hypothetical protein